MPLIIVDVIRGQDEPYLTTLLDSIHDAVVEAFDVPATDRYQVLTQHEPFELRALDTDLGYTRTDNLTVIRVVSKARTPSAKETLYELIARNVRDRLGIDGDDVIVSVVENSDADWSFGHGRAQFLTGELPGSEDRP
ncbi:MULTISPECIES: tautomerase family protein [unclassified Microbacterium]|uniref:tautomerase family protein n=1 Tax=Microbacterium TaxID=33882 RepID=UPI003BA16BD5